MRGRGEIFYFSGSSHEPHALHTGYMNYLNGANAMKRESQILRLQEYLRDPDFWVFIVSVMTSIAVFNLPVS